jgi:hypothetical protein
MTPQEVQEYARQQYNSVGDDFFSDTELYRHVWAAQMDLALKSRCIRRVYTTSTVVAQHEYSKPTNTISIKRITYNGQKLLPITMREDDALTLSNSLTSQSGTPQYYYEWGDSFFLRAIPDAVGALKVYSFNKPQEVTSASTLEVPDRYHLQLADYLIWKQAAKDKNWDAARFYQEIWMKTLKEAVGYERTLLRGDAFATVQDVETLPSTVIGTI